MAAQHPTATSMCNWVEDNGFETPECAENAHFKTCAYECHDERTCFEELNGIEECGVEANRTSSTTRHSKCVCDDGYFLEQGVCVSRDDCDTLPGAWNDWQEWGACTEPCGGIAHRNRICRGPNPCEGEHQDMKECHISDENSACGKISKNYIIKNDN